MVATILLFILGLVILLAGADLHAHGETCLTAAMIEVDEPAKSRSKEDQA